MIKIAIVIALIAVAGMIYSIWPHSDEPLHFDGVDVPVEALRQNARENAAASPDFCATVGTIIDVDAYARSTNETMLRDAQTTAKFRLLPGAEIRRDQKGDLDSIKRWLRILIQECH